MADAVLAMLLALLSLPSLLLAPLPLLPSLFLDSQRPCAASFFAVAATQFAASTRAASFAALAAARFAASARTDLAAARFTTSNALISLLLDSPLLTTPLPLMLVLFPFGNGTSGIPSFADTCCPRLVRQNEEMSHIIH